MKESQAPFLHIPFSSQPYEVAEGWIYSAEERAIHGRDKHHGIDYRLPKGTPVLASANGWAISSYYGFQVKKEGKDVIYKGKRVGLGYGYFVQIYHPDTKLYTLYGHLERIADGIKFHNPRRSGDVWWPVGNKVLGGNRLKNYKHKTTVEKGQAVGYVGDSGLTWGYEDFPERPDHEKFPSWDETHLHFEVFERYGSEKRKRLIDPYGIKGRATDYPNSSERGNKMGVEGPVLWVLGEDGMPEFVVSKT